MAFSWKDHTVKLVSSVLLNQTEREKRLFSGNKAMIDPGVKTSVMKGYDLKPFDILYSAAEPKWSLEGMAADEVQDSVIHVGRLGGPSFDVIVIVQRPGQLTRTIKITQAKIGEGADWGADEGAGATGKIGGSCRDILIATGNARLRSIFAARAA